MCRGFAPRTGSGQFRKHLNKEEAFRSPTFNVSQYASTSHKPAQTCLKRTYAAQGHSISGEGKSKGRWKCPSEISPMTAPETRRILTFIGGGLSLWPHTADLAELGVILQDRKGGGGHCEGLMSLLIFAPQHRRPKSIHQHCAKGSPTTTLKALWCICIFLLFPMKTSFLVYTKPLFCLLRHLSFQS